MSLENRTFQILQGHRTKVHQLDNGKTTDIPYRGSLRNVSSRGGLSCLEYQSLEDTYLSQGSE